MYPVNSTFHTLSIQDAPKTRVRVYFIGAGVDCTDDNAVQTNGTLLVGAVGDTDSNGRIGQNGITFTEMFNPDKNIQIGTAVSYQIGMTLLNTDGALNGFSYGRCKVYLDVYDAANSAWRVCPMGVFVIDIPTKRRVQLVSATGYDQMQLLDTICDSWWSGLNWSGGITLSALLTSMANQLGVKVSTATASALLNSSVSYTEAPFACVEVTYREVLEYIAEATGTIARFDRDGYLDLRFFSAAQISGNTVTINADTVGNTCLDIDIAEYQAAAIDLLKVKIAEDDIGVTVGSGTNQYIIVNNLFLYGSTATIITNRATPIYNRLNGLGAYTPLQAKLIYDWSLEAGDIINIVKDSTTYPVLIFQQTLTWRGGYVTANILADGDNVRPVMDYDERASYRMASEMSQKVGDNEIISKINQTAESIQIQASKVDLAGYVTFTNLSTSGQTTIDGGNITTGTIDASTVTVNNINASNISSGTLSADRIAAGSLAIGKLDSTTQNTITTAASEASTALTNAATAQSTAEGANSQEQLIYISKAIGTTTQSGTTTWVTNATGNQNTWTIKRPTYNSSYPVLFVATQRKNVAGTVTCTTPQIDNTTTVIDGGHITTGTIDASVVNVTNLNASNITSGTMSASKIQGGDLVLGGNNNTNGTMTVKDSSGNTAATVNNNGITINGSTSKTVLDGGLVKIQNASAAAQNVSLEYVPISGTSPAGYIQKMYTPSSGARTVSEGFWWYIGNKAVAEIYSAGDSVANCDGFVGMGVGWTPISGSAKFVIDKLRSSDIEAKDLSVYGVLDVKQRRCYAALSQRGWYRVFNVTGGLGRAGSAFSIVLHIGRSYINNNNELHTVTLLANYYNQEFSSEISKSNSLGITKVRYTADGSNNGHIDIYYDLTAENFVYVDFDVHCRPENAYLIRYNSVTPTAVADSPSGETVLTEYTFVANTDGDITSQITFNNAAIATARRSGNIINISYQGNNIAHSDGEVIATFPDGLLPSSTHWCIGSIIGVPTVLRIRRVGIDIWYAPSYPSGRLYFEATYIL